MPQPVAAISSSPAPSSADSSSSASRLRDTSSSFQETLGRAQESQTPDSDGASATPQPTSQSAAPAKKSSKDGRQNSAPSTTPAQQKPSDANQKTSPAPDEKPETPPDQRGRQKQDQKEPAALQLKQPIKTLVQPEIATPQPELTPSPKAQAIEGRSPVTGKAIVVTGAQDAAKGTVPAHDNDASAPLPAQSDPAAMDSNTPQPLPAARIPQGQEPEPAVAAARDQATQPVPEAKPIKAGKQPAPVPAGAADSSAADNPVGAGPSAPTSDATTSTPAQKPADDILVRIGIPDAFVQFHAQSVNPAATETIAPKNIVPPPEGQFAELNHPKLVQAIHGQLLPSGGTMTLRLDPPELGAMNVRVEVHDGVINASFEAANDQTAKLLSHSLGDLKTALESQGVSVEKLHVTQAPKEHTSSQNDSRQQTDRGSQDRSMQQEQQRRELMRRMWRRLMKGEDPLDLVA
jgi:flagellar hook-length control protein FliK